MARKPRVTEKIELIIDATYNVFADIKVPNPEDVLVRCELAWYIRQLVKSLRLTRKAAAARMELEPSEAAALFSHESSQFSRERLLGMLRKLGYDVRVVVQSRASRLRGVARRVKKPAPARRTRAAFA